MKKYFNKDNVTALVIVIAGVILTTYIAPTINGWVNKLRGKMA